LPKLIFCCDANAASGLGHFTRCHDLALALRGAASDFELAFLGNYSEHALRTLNQEHYSVREVSGASFSVCDLERWLAKGDVVFLDSYAAEQSFHDFLNDRQTRWAAFDDLGTLSFAGARLVINSRLHAERLFNYHSIRAALGPQFMPIHPELLAVRASREGLIGPRLPETILVFIGGNDMFQMSGRLANLAAEIFPSAQVQLVMSGPELSPASGPRLAPNVECRPLQASLAPLLARADLLISGGGRLKYEASFALVPNAALNQTSLQASDSQILAQVGLIVDLGLASSFDEAGVRRGLGLLGSSECRAAMRVVQAEHFPKHQNRPLLAALREAFVPGA
jgi:spore coat polysaccharide biosynthesis predicted glycosyltransferase SpsG